MPVTDTVQLPVNDPCKSRYLAKNVQRCYLLRYSYIIVLLYSLGCIQTLPTCQTLITLIKLIIESFLSSEQITLTQSVERRYLLTYSYDIVLLYSLGCIHPIPTCQTLITLITLVIESFVPSIQITLTLSVQRRYLLTYSYDIILLYSLGCIKTLPTCQTLITLIIESVISSRKITLTLSYQQRCSLTYSNNIVFLHPPGCINILPTCQTLVTLITLITESDISYRKITLTFSFQQRYLLTRSYNIVFLFSLGSTNILLGLLWFSPTAVRGLWGSTHC